jgi:aminoglycoside 3-N-acetyltransferase
MRDLIKRVMPLRTISLLRRWRNELQNVRMQFYSPMTECVFRNVLTDELGLGRGDVVFVHSSTGHLKLTFPTLQVFHLLRDVIGQDGTLLFPTYPRDSSYEFLLSGEVFDVRKSRSYTGLLTEYARVQKGALRSLHPTKSVCAIGPLAVELTQGHNLSPFPYDRDSPYHKIIKVGGKIIGIGVSTSKLSFVHTVDDKLKDGFPVKPYHNQLFEARCVSYSNEVIIVKTYAHDMGKMKHDIPKFVKKYCTPPISRDLRFRGMNFFVIHSEPFFNRMVELAINGITVYDRSVYG